MDTIVYELTTAEIAKRVNLSPNRVRQLAVDGAIKARKPSREWWIPVSEIEVVRARPERRGRPKKGQEK